jgi:hypothetical protein
MEGGCFGGCSSSFFSSCSCRGRLSFVGGSTKIVTVLTSDSENETGTFAESIMNEKRNEKINRNKL